MWYMCCGVCFVLSCVSCMCVLFVCVCVRLLCVRVFVVCARICCVRAFVVRVFVVRACKSCVFVVSTFLRMVVFLLIFARLCVC